MVWVFKTHLSCVQHYVWVICCIFFLRPPCVHVILVMHYDHPIYGVGYSPTNHQSAEVSNAATAPLNQFGINNSIGLGKLQYFTNLT